MATSNKRDLAPRLPILIYLMVLDGSHPSEWKPFDNLKMGQIREDIAKLTSEHRFLKKPIELQIICRPFDDVEKAAYRRVVGCLVDSTRLQDDVYKQFKEDYELFLGKVIEAENDISQYQGFRLIIVESTGAETNYTDAVDDLSSITKIALNLPGMGFRYEYLREERRFNQIANTMLGEVRINQDLTKILAN